MTTPRVGMRRRLVLGSGAALLVLLASACGGSGHSEAGVPTADQQTGGSAPSPTNPDGDMFAWAACMRDHGIPYSDPDPQIGKPILQVDANGKFDAGGPQGPSDAEMAAAEEACRAFEVAGSSTPDPELQAERDQMLLDWAACMRDHGVEVADDPVDPEGRDPSAAPSGTAAPQVFEAAEQACRDVGEPGGDG